MYAIVGKNIHTPDFISGEIYHLKDDLKAMQRVGHKDAKIIKVKISMEAMSAGRYPRSSQGRSS